MNALLATIAVWSYGFAAVGYLAFAIRVSLGWHRSVRGALLFATMLATALWAFAGLAVAVWQSPWSELAANAADAARYAIWFLFVINLLAGAGNRWFDDKGRAGGLPRWLVAMVIAALLGAAVLSAGPPVSDMVGPQGQRVEFALRIGLAVFGLTLVEQLFRRADQEARWRIKPLCVALGGIFGFDIFFYADAVLFARLDVDIWIARAIANALVIPFIAISTARNTGWTVEMHLSRNVVFQSTALLVSSAFVIAIAAAGYYVRYFSSDWGRALQIEIFFAAVLFLVLVASSGSARSKLKVFISKHFFSYRYDYREEWLRFTRSISAENSSRAIQERAIVALANLVESPAGALWLKTVGGGFQQVARWNLPVIDAIEPEDGPLASFLKRLDWVIDLHECASFPDHYEGLVLPAWLASVANAWLVVPLRSGKDMIGFVVLTTPRAAIEVNWEVRDLLKTASRQAASYIGHLHATEALLESRKFDAFNRMSAFVVHDLKNLVAQLSLMLSNAERHRHNPEFQKDMLSTAENVVERMNKLMLQLRTGATPVESPWPVDLGSVIRRVCAAKAGPGRTIALEISGKVVASGHEDQLEHVIGHLIQNALDATADRGSIAIRLTPDGDHAVVEVTDTGVGMTKEFVRERLYKPFETTKKQGMGIGVYESSQYVAGIGGQLLIDSTPGKGTRVRVLLPLATGSSVPLASKQEVA